MVAGIYLITNKINGHMYIGGSIDITRRFKSHKNCCDIKTSAIDKAINKYGKENFSYQIITELPADWNIIGQHEKYWINFYNTFENKKHYNLTSGGEKNFEVSEESRKKMSENRPDISGKNNPNYGNPSNWSPSQEHKNKISELMKGDKNPTKNPEVAKKISETLTGREFSEKHKKNISKSKTGKCSGKNNPMWGQKHTPEARKKMSENSGVWKNYARIVKSGSRNGKQRYRIQYNGQRIMYSTNKEKLYERWYEKYPDIELIDETI